MQSDVTWNFYSSVRSDYEVFTGWHGVYDRNLAERAVVIL